MSSRSARAAVGSAGRCDRKHKPNRNADPMGKTTIRGSRSWRFSGYQATDAAASIVRAAVDAVPCPRSSCELRREIVVRCGDGLARAIHCSGEAHPSRRPRRTLCKRKCCKAGKGLRGPDMMPWCANPGPPCSNGATTNRPSLRVRWAGTCASPFPIGMSRNSSLSGASLRITPPSGVGFSATRPN